AEIEKIHRAIHGEDGHTHVHDGADDHAHAHDHSRDHDHSAHRGYRQIMGLIDSAGLAEETRQYLTDIYTVIAKAEAEVHGEDIDTVHFHEVGRDEALLNLTGTAAATASFRPDRTICSPVHDGHGTIKCSHGIIPVPVPAVGAMKKYCDYVFVQDNVETEMVTPSGLGILIGLGAVCGEKPEGTPASQGEGKGSRDIGRTEGLKISIYE
ncbi:MAG: DUF111 family protein, partial [Firmicutes bacterium]|nr:DUF111 family protein [Bacillota bacterium]